jgi:hypothetical protein
MSTVDNTVYIEVDGEKLIKSAFEENKLTTVTTEICQPATAELTISLQERIHFLEMQNEELRKENIKLTEKVLEQSDKMLPLIEQAQKLAENAQTLHAIESVKPQLMDEKKHGLFQRLFSRNKE